MRTPLLIPVLGLLGGCLAPGERDPTRYPWDPRNRVASVPPGSSYCIIAIEQENKIGIVVGGKASVMACSAPGNPAPGSTPR